MNKRQTRLFAIGSTVVAGLVFLGLTVDSHRQFGRLTNAQNLTPEVIHGKDVWHKYNCINCHTLLGEGAYYAPDLTKITMHRGVEYLRVYLRDPSRFYDEQRHRRLMPKQNLSENEIADVIAFLDWISKIDNQGWPPRPILVAGAAFPGTDLSARQASAKATGATDRALPPGARPVTAADDPIALGEALFRSVTPPCNTCHSIAPGVTLVGPSLSGVSARFEQLRASGAYKGAATNPEEYIRESIKTPSRHIVPGPMYSANGLSFMPNTYAGTLSDAQFDRLVAYLATLR
jgi:nitric oxide reductase subunit C